MLPYNPDDAKHCTATCSRSNGEPVGLDLFDDEFTDPNGPQTSIYERYENGKRWPCRTVTMKPGHFETVLQAWGDRDGIIFDYRTTLHGVGLSGVDMRGSEQVAA